MFHDDWVTIQMQQISKPRPKQQSQQPMEADLPAVIKILGQSRFIFCGKHRQRPVKSAWGGVGRMQLM